MSNKSLTVVAVLAVLLVVGSLWLTSRAVTPKTATMEDVAAEAETGGYRLIATGELAAAYGRAPQPLLVDTRQDWEYRAGHIEGAVLFPMEPTWWSRWRKADDLARLLGPDKGRPVVFY